ncbi:type II toxin-antitoxin system Phd/YefM family antitoxin [Novosphingobium album (ex Liu et al. 2023)]|uniref:Antitoxin n=1 Tax=Novosphingobium album (ex Liu et al. 2023) TaxID=3031130 RepID=A0ABT5WLJ4_9SPHN|nr:type II toxin-antitoxin system prevent-host-death family antitoxin [Novosphingobium album (ex Liu et al. 2023)]MDE8650917.1 type II toxin-antitoxin system prevent-host-death family antitoxin [Novosphingobium album (ex Liu et al. 2023)]
MASYSIATTKDRLSALIDRARAGEDIVITNRGKPTARLVPVDVDGSPDVVAATGRLRARIAGHGAASIPVHRFGDWLYEDEAG